MVDEWIPAFGMTVILGNDGYAAPMRLCRDDGDLISIQ
jgi:hypothetical protein